MKLSYSSIQAFLSCERRFEWAYISGLRKDVPNRNLRIGSAYHAGLDVLKKGETLEKALTIIEQIYRVIPSWARNSEDWWVEREISMRLVMGWHDHMMPLKVLSSEKRFEIPIIHPDTGERSPYTLIGFIDGIVEDEHGQAVMEHKSTDSDISPHSLYAERLAIDLQVDIYLIAARHLGYDVTTVLYDVARKPAIRPRKVQKKKLSDLYNTGRYYGEEIPDNYRATRESFAMYGARLTHEINTSHKRYFARYPIVRLNRHLRQARLELWEQAERIRVSRERGHFLKNAQACLTPYRCAFADLCFNGHEPSQVTEERIPRGYTTRRHEKCQ